MKTTVKGEADRLDSAIQHDPEFDESWRYQPRTYAWKVLFPVPKVVLGYRNQRKACMADFSNMSTRLQSCTELILEEDIKNAIETPHYEYHRQSDQPTADFWEVITHSSYSLSFLLPGRLIKIKYRNSDFGWGVVINFQKRVPRGPCSSQHIA